jgi:hypothetical protein
MKATRKEAGEKATEEAGEGRTSLKARGPEGPVLHLLRRYSLHVKGQTKIEREET